MSTATAQFTHATISTTRLLRAIAPSPTVLIFEVAHLLDEARKQLELITDDIESREPDAAEYVEFLNHEMALMCRIEILERRHALALVDFAIELEEVAQKFRCQGSIVGAQSGEKARQHRQAAEMQTGKSA